MLATQTAEWAGGEVLYCANWYRASDTILLVFQVKKFGCCAGCALASDVLTSAAISAAGNTSVSRVRVLTGTAGFCCFACTSSIN